MTPEFILQLIGQVGVGVGVYAAIRSDIARLQENQKFHAERLSTLEKRKA